MKAMLLAKLLALLLAMLLALALFAAPLAQAETKCEKYCTPGVSKPCGASCIPIASNCRKSWTTCCTGERPVKAKAVFENPTKVDKRPEGGK